MPTADHTPMIGLTLERRSGFEFVVRLDEPGIPEFVTDEGPPIGAGRRQPEFADWGARVKRTFTCLQAAR